MTEPTRSTSETSVSDSSDLQTEIPHPRARVFLQQSWIERLKGGMWAMTWHALFRLSPPMLSGWRNVLLRIFGARIGRGVHIAPSVLIQFPWNLSIGDHAYIAHGVILNCMGEVQIGENTRISQYAHVCAGTHRHDQRDMPILRSPVFIGEDCWIAADAFVGPNVSIGAGSVLAARSSAFGDLPGDSVCVGEPARPIKQRDEDEDHAQPTSRRQSDSAIA